MLEPSTLFLTLAGVFVIAFMKGSFGGGFAIIGIPLLALVMDPLTAGALLAPLFVAMDVFALRYWKPATWSKPDLALLLPGLVAGIVAGTLLLSVLDGRAITIIIALITLVFAGLWFKGGGEVVVRPRSVPKALAAGIGSGVSATRQGWSRGNGVCDDPMKPCLSSSGCETRPAKGEPARPVASLAPETVTDSAKRRHASEWAVGR